MADRDPNLLFWLAVYRALQAICAAIKKRYLGGKVEQQNTAS